MLESAFFISYIHFVIFIGFWMLERCRSFVSYIHFDEFYGIWMPELNGWFIFCIRFDRFFDFGMHKPGCYIRRLPRNTKSHEEPFIYTVSDYSSNQVCKEAFETSNPYMDNAQVVVVKAAVADQYQTEESIKSLKFAVEKESAGDEIITGLGITPTRLTTQADALLEVKAGTSEACVIDLLMALSMTGEGTDYPELTYTVKLNSEQYGVGFRKGSDLAAKLNDFMKSSYDKGDTKAIADRYKVAATLVAQ